MTPITFPDPPLYFSLERFIMIDISWIVCSVFYFKISVSFPDQSSKICIYQWIQIFLFGNFRWNELILLIPRCSWLLKACQSDSASFSFSSPERGVRSQISSLKPCINSLKPSQSALQYNTNFN